MKNLTNTTKVVTFSAGEAIFGQRVARALSQGNATLPHDISERLRVARMQALSAAKTTMRTATAVQRSGSATLIMGGSEINLWQRFAAFVPLAALVVGLLAINAMQDDDGANEAAEVDAALLTDNLPPAAYTDPGFAHFLRVGGESAQ